ncbi:MAG: type I DNA topoisomerase [Pirellulaceae bacterium]|nr:type I DNA topoisomerase [Pirellulaceae bacterium]
MSDRKSLVIVESPAKARTISKFLGKEFVVEASIGHIRDLPRSSELPDEYKKKDWAYLAVNTEEDFQPVYVVPADKKKQVAKLKQQLKECKDLYLATDEDREGEAISWHLQEVLKPKVPVRRLVFHEITREAIQSALANSREIDEALVRAQETRRILDRLYGFDVSRILWFKVRPKLSAGRVQSVAVRLIVDRERERMAFHSATYADLVAGLATQSSSPFNATLISYQGRSIPSGKDFDPATGQLKDPALLWLNLQQAQELADQLRAKPFHVRSVEVKPFAERPKPPFTTSTLQQEANRKLGFTARRTMQIAQYLYENGHITYMRTDSTALSNEAVKAARELVRQEYGDGFLHDSVRVYATKVKNAQEAHEAIRPAGNTFELPRVVRGVLNDEQFKLFDMIWKRTIACQMADARKRRVIATIEADGAVFQASGTTIEFEGFLRAYVEGTDNPEEALAEQEVLLPEMQADQVLDCRSLEAKSHTTQPPARYTEASLTRTLEERGIGRPSTYASIIDTIQNRDYVFKKGSALVPTWTAFTVVRMLEEHFGSLVDYDFTAQMEESLDEISRDERDYLDYLRNFYFGNESAAGLKPLLASKLGEIDPKVTSRYSLGKPADSGSDTEVFVRDGRFGPFIEHGDRKASIPQGLAPDELTLAKALELLQGAAQAEQPLGHCPDSGKPIYIKNGRFGTYIQLGDNDDPEKRNASLLRGMTGDQIDLALALKLLSLPRDLGPHPTLGESITVLNGKFGPYIKCGSENRSLPTGLSPLDITADQAIELLNQPKTRGRGAAKREPIKSFAESPVTGNIVQVLDGRFGAYVTDGTTNATVPKDSDPSQLTFEAALDLLATRAAMGGGKKKVARRGGAAKESTGTKRATKKKTPANKGTKKATKKTTKKSVKKANDS